jgi:hypothetical protein
MIGTLRRELLDRILVVNERHLRRILTIYLHHFNTARPPNGLPHWDRWFDIGIAVEDVVWIVDRVDPGQSPVFGRSVGARTRSSSRCASELT